MQLAGELSKISLPSLVQLVRNGGLTGEISLAQGAKTATIYVERGRVAHVESDAGSGREAFLDLFLWMTGTFSFIEGNLGDIVRTIPADEPMDRLLREGVTYLEQKRYLDQLRINGQTVLRPTAAARHAREVPLLDMLDGRKSLSAALADSRMSRREYIQAVYRLISDGLAVVAESEMPEDTDRISLPGWVVARLQQDNADLSQAIINMVIWVDRVKCWMYQADADMGRIMQELLAESEATAVPPPPVFAEPEPIPDEPEPPPRLLSDQVAAGPAPTALPAAPAPPLSSLLKSSAPSTSPTAGSFPGGPSASPGPQTPQSAVPPSVPPQQAEVAEPSNAPARQMSAREAMRLARQARQAQSASTSQAQPQQARPQPAAARQPAQSPPASSEQDQPALPSLAGGLQTPPLPPSPTPFPNTNPQLPTIPQGLTPVRKPATPAEALGQQLQTEATRPSAALSLPATAASETAQAALPPDKPPQPPADQHEQDAQEEQQSGRAETAAKADWPKSSVPKKANVDTYPPKPKPSIEF